MEFAADRSRRTALCRSIARDDRPQRLRCSALQQPASSRQTSPHLLGASYELQDFWRERFRSALSIRRCGCIHRIVDLRLGFANWRNQDGMVGCNHFHVFVADISSRQGCRGRYVAGLICHACTLERLRTVAGPTFTGESNIKPQTSNILLVVGILLLTGIRIPCQRSHRLDAAADSWNDNVFYSQCSTGPAIQICAWHSPYSHHRCPLGNSGAASNAWTILRCGNRSTRSWPFVCLDGRSRREFVRDLSPPAAILFRNNLYRFFPVVDQTSLVDEEIVATPE